jgi:hypothetical protein
LKGLGKLIRFHSLLDSIYEFVRSLHTNVSQNKRLFQLVPDFFAKRTSVKNMSYLAKPGFFTLPHSLLNSTWLLRQSGSPIKSLKCNITIVADL